MTVDDEVKVIASAAAAAARTSGSGRRRHRAVRLDDVDLPAAGPEALGQHVSGDRGPGQQHPAGAVGGPGRHGVEQRLGHELLGHEVGDHPVAAERVRGAAADRRDLHPAEGPGVGDLGEEAGRPR